MLSIKRRVKSELLSYIQRRMLFFVMLVLTITSIAIILIGLLFENHEVDEIFDDRLAQ